MRIAGLYRFPFKGFPAEEIAEALVVRGRGILGDRIAAFTNGSLEIPDGAWHGCKAFTMLKYDTSLQKWQVGIELDSPAPAAAETRAPAAEVTLTTPTGEATTFRTDDPEERAESAEFLSAFLPSRGTLPRKIAVADQGMFDSRLAGISLINPATVDAIAATSEGRAALGLTEATSSSTSLLDPLRFRGNVLLEGLGPFEEFGLIGKIVRLGGVRLAITQAIERCPATTVNPSTTEVDVNVPRILASACGHLHCGIYGQILETGTVTKGDTIEIEGEAPADLVPTSRSPRFLTVVSRQQICNDIVEVSLRDDLGWIREFDEPGTNLRVHLDLGEPFWRTYTITGVEEDIVSIAVRTQGKGSRAVAGLEPGQRILASGPHGTMTADRVFGGTTALVTAGIGITPSLGLLRGQALEGTTNVKLFHVDRDHRTACLWNRLQNRAGASGVPIDVHHHDTALSGRPTHADLVDWLAGCDNVMVCGPADFTRNVLDASAEAGVGSVHQETFASPNTGMSEAIAKCPPAEVTLEYSGTSFVWGPEQGTLLDALEAQGLNAASSCRGGSCGTCAVKLGAGSVLYPVEPAARINADEVLLCSAVPAEPISLKL